MNKTALKLVTKAVLPMPFDDDRGKRRVTALRAQLLAAAVRYVAEGKDGTRRDRMRAASDMSGIPLAYIEIEAAC